MLVIQKQSGVTLIELLLVIALVSIIAASVSPFLSRFILQNSLEVSTGYTVGFLRKAQAYSIDGKNDAAWGTCITGPILRLYRGTCASPAVSDDYSIPPVTTITGLTDVTFSKRRGEPSIPLTITIATTLGSNTITVNEAGGMTIN